jgi:hypothetical protein
MLVTWLGALLIFGGVLFMAFQAIWRGRLSGRSGSAVVSDSPEPRERASNTLEPQERGGLSFAKSWPGLALIALGALLLLI